jgi:hypothetical protein
MFTPQTGTVFYWKFSDRYMLQDGWEGKACTTEILSVINPIQADKNIHNPN